MLKSSEPKMIYVEGGSFKMGNEQVGYENEQPVHEVTVNSFYISKYPITVKQYRLFCEKTDKKMPEKPSWGWLNDHPIVNVSWHDAKDYCEWLNGRLPTETEWEFAARGGKQSKFYEYSGSNEKTLKHFALYSKCKTYIVGTKKPNELGLFDMSGNVWEWCMDWYDNYDIKSQINPKNISKGDKRVQRGGSWRTGIFQLRSTNRNKENPNSKYNDVGFRLVRDIPIEKITQLEKQLITIEQQINELQQPIAKLEKKLIS
ncbi:formylglycine-generating enzyme family protein [Thiotrichales bacterium HSG1]|nr:formylglycine-generating enzyme family protein [Thiotrichales bacterium HSG1]